MGIASANPPFIDADTLAADLVTVAFQFLLETEDRHLGIHKKI